MKNVKSALRLIALVAFSGSAARAQDVRLKLIHDDATRAVVAERLGSASARGVPTEPLMSKALEGVAKRATPKDIKNAMNALEKRLRLASELLSPTVSVDEMAAGADALAAGVSEKSLKALRTAAPTRSVAMELGVLTELVARGVPAKQAASNPARAAVSRSRRRRRRANASRAAGSAMTAGDSSARTAHAAAASSTTRLGAAASVGTGPRRAAASRP